MSLVLLDRDIWIDVFRVQSRIEDRAESILSVRTLNPRKAQNDSRSATILIFKFARALRI